MHFSYGILFERAVNCNWSFEKENLPCKKRTSNHNFFLFDSFYINRSHVYSTDKEKMIINYICIIRWRKR